MQNQADFSAAVQTIIDRSHGAITVEDKFESIIPSSKGGATLQKGCYVVIPTDWQHLTKGTITNTQKDKNGEIISQITYEGAYLPVMLDNTIVPTPVSIRSFNRSATPWNEETNTAAGERQTPKGNVHKVIDALVAPNGDDVLQALAGKVIKVTNVHEVTIKAGYKVRVYDMEFVAENQIPEGLEGFIAEGPDVDEPQAQPRRKSNHKANA